MNNEKQCEHRGMWNATDKTNIFQCSECGNISEGAKKYCGHCGMPMERSVNCRTSRFGKMTNGDQIRQMTDEELARVLVFRDCANDLVVCPKMNQGNSCIHSCTDTFLEWLKQVKDDDKV